MQVRHRNDGLVKRCSCPRRAWTKCAHPWHVGIQIGGKEYRYSLHKRFGKPPGYEMTKTEAKSLRQELSNQIRENLAVGMPGVSPDAKRTFGDLCDEYLKHHVRVPSRRKTAVAAMKRHIEVLRTTDVPGPARTRVCLADKSLAAITKADVEAIRTERREAVQRVLEEKRRRAEVDAEPKVEGQTPVQREPLPRLGKKGGEVETNRLLARLRHMINWAIGEGWVDETPFKRHGVTVVKLDRRVETPRQRRLRPGEEESLLKHAAPHLRSLVVAALSTGCREGELLNLCWKHLRGDDKERFRWIELSAGQTKTNEARVIPIGSTLRAELEMRRLDPAGKEHKPEKYVFGNAVGERVASIKTAWRTLCRKAEIEDLHFHDLRREFACRLLEAGAALHDTREFLGHADISTTSRYLRSAPVRLEKAIARMEEAATGRTNVAQTPKSGDQAEAAGEPAAAPNMLH